MNGRHLEMETDELFRRIRKKYRFFRRTRTFEKGYRPLVPLNSSKPIEDYTDEERRVYYNWFMENLAPRCEYLRRLVAEDAAVTITSLDYSFESLRPLWKWFLSRARILVKRNLPPYEYATKYGTENEYKGEKVSNKFSMRFDIKTEMMIRDIGMYVGMVFTKTYPVQIVWICQREKDVHANLPVLAGFEQKIDTSGAPLKKAFHPKFEPIWMTGVQAAKMFEDNAKPDDLYNMCMLWSQWISNRSM